MLIARELSMSEEEVLSWSAERFSRWAGFLRLEDKDKARELRRIRQQSQGPKRPRGFRRR